MSDLKIVVQGPAGSGKSTLAALIKRALLNKNMDISVLDDSFDHAGNFSPERIEQSIEALAERGTSIEVVTLMIPRSSASD